MEVEPPFRALHKAGRTADLSNGKRVMFNMYMVTRYVSGRCLQGLLHRFLLCGAVTPIHSSCCS